MWKVKVALLPVVIGAFPKWENHSGRFWRSLYRTG